MKTITEYLINENKISLKSEPNINELAALIAHRLAYGKYDVNDIDCSHCTDLRALFKLIFDSPWWDGDDVCELDSSTFNKIKGIENWDVSKVKYMDQLFNSKNLVDADFTKLEAWDVSHVESMNNIFPKGATKLPSWYKK